VLAGLNHLARLHQDRQQTIAQRNSGQLDEKFFEAGS
jgi:hypothetical protein